MLFTRDTPQIPGHRKFKVGDFNTSRSIINRTSRHNNQ